MASAQARNTSWALSGGDLKSTEFLDLSVIRDPANQSGLEGGGDPWEAVNVGAGGNKVGKGGY